MFGLIGILLRGEELTNTYGDRYWLIRKIKPALSPTNKIIDLTNKLKLIKQKVDKIKSQKLINNI